jgi:hypothetical protein
MLVPCSCGRPAEAPPGDPQRAAPWVAPPEVSDTTSVARTLDLAVSIAGNMNGRGALPA